MVAEEDFSSVSLSSFKTLPRSEKDNVEREREGRRLA